MQTLPVRAQRMADGSVYAGAELWPLADGGLEFVVQLPLQDVQRRPFAEWVFSRQRQVQGRRQGIDVTAGVHGTGVVKLFRSGELHRPQAKVGSGQPTQR